MRLSTSKKTGSRTTATTFTSLPAGDTYGVTEGSQCGGRGCQQLACWQPQFTLQPRPGSADRYTILMTMDLRLCEDCCGSAQSLKVLSKTGFDEIASSLQRSGRPAPCRSRASMGFVPLFDH